MTALTAIDARSFIGKQLRTALRANDSAEHELVCPDVKRFLKGWWMRLDHTLTQLL